MARVAAAGDLPFLSPDGKCETFGVNQQFRGLESRPQQMSPALETMPKRVIKFPWYLLPLSPDRLVPVDVC